MLLTAPLVLKAALAVVKPLIGLMLRHGVTYPAFAAALKEVFLTCAQEELRAQGAVLTDSAVSLRSGVHRRDVRMLLRSDVSSEPPAGIGASMQPIGLATQVVARWLSEAVYADDQGEPKALARSTSADGFDTLVASTSSDVRPRAVLDELLRLGIVQETDGQVRLLSAGFAPREDFVEMAQLMQLNLHDHLAAATENLDGRNNFLEQAVFVDQLTKQSAQHLHAVSTKAWRQAFKIVMREAASRFEHDQQHASAEERHHRARFGAYFYSTPEPPHDATPT